MKIDNTYFQLMYQALTQKLKMCRRLRSALRILSYLS